MSRVKPATGSDGTSAHNYSLIKYLASKDVCVVYLFLGEDDLRSIEGVCYFTKNQKSFSDFDSPASDKEIIFFRKLVKLIQPSVVVVDYTWMADLLDYVDKSKVKKVIFCHDLRVNILASYVAMGIERDVRGWVFEREASLVKKADFLMVLCCSDAKTLTKMNPQATLIEIGMPVSEMEQINSKTVPGSCIYVASDLPENLYALNWFIRNVWPLLLAERPNFYSIMICGSIGNKILSIYGHQYLENCRIKVMGYVENLSDLYKQSQVAIVPHFMNGGVKIKAIEALSYGKAVVGTSLGLEGIAEANGLVGLVADEPEDFALSISKILTDDQFNEQLQKNIRDYRQLHVPDYVYSNMNVLL